MEEGMEEGMEEHAGPLSREERFEELARRREERRRERRSSRALGWLSVVVMAGVGIYAMGPSLRLPGSKPAAATEDDLSGPIRDILDAARSGGFAVAKVELAQLRHEGMSEEGRQSLADASQRLASLQERWEQTLQRIEEAEEVRRQGRLAEADKALDAVHRESADLPILRDRVWSQLQSLQKERRQRGNVDTLVPYDKQSLARLDALLRDRHYARAQALLGALQAEGEDEEYDLLVLQRRVREETELGGRSMLARVQQSVDRGHILIAVQMLYADEIRAFEGTEMWLPLLRKAEEIEDLIDARGGRRPFARRRHLPKEDRE